MTEGPAPARASGRSLRSKPLLLASLVPLWAILGIYAAETLRGTRFLSPFVIAWALLAAAFFGYVLRQTLAARRSRR